ARLFLSLAAKGTSCSCAQSARPEHDSGSGLQPLLLVEKGRRCRPFPPGHVSPAPGGAAGETCSETLLRKISEPAAHVAGFGLHLEGFGPPSLPKGVCRCGW